MSNKLQTYEGGHSYSGYRSSKTQCGTGGSREPPVPVKEVRQFGNLATLETGSAAIWQLRAATFIYPHRQATRKEVRTP